MRIIQIRNVDTFSEKIRPKQSTQNKKIVESIISDVQKNGDSALKKYEKKFNKTKSASLRVTKSEIQNAYSRLSKEEILAIKTAKNRLSRSESKLKAILKNFTINVDGVKISKSFTPIKNVGCYVPGGMARYPSSAIMSIVPAKIAGVKRIVVVSPPDTTGKIDPMTIVSADICGASEIFKIGGAQAIAALSYGTKSLNPVDKIVGPGGPFVTMAKSILSERTSIDMNAGPTELGIIVDDSSPVHLVVDDLISQAEHSADTFCYVLTTSHTVGKKINQLITEKIKSAPRANIVKSSLKRNGFIGICKSKDDLVILANSLAPEHLEIMTKDAKKLAKKIKAPGLVLIGNNSPSSASDYLLGSNHILPTNGFGRTRGSLSVMDFLKISTTVEATKPALKKISKSMKAFTDTEGLSNHYNAVESRLK
ncbi:histidinol dehydrogenase [Nitrosopumilus sp. b1]|uniref:histidinol dehydrogenase n=1 Tax=Nitrosopumilus sp. b1 TaxID=2109907 RepID=UPI0015F4A31E|nr:histidinol dehydrogenase [Nitrosopumilus sp. b1]KAF6242356.1 histidinol dehydrogenase [Nitrosopumilus sp. b1]